MHQVHLSNFLNWLVIKNKSFHPFFKYPYLTKQILEHVKLLLTYNLIEGYRIDRDVKIPNNWTITVYLKYNSNTYPVLRQIKFFSRPGCYRYLTLKKIFPLVKTASVGNSLFVLSTSNGVLTAHECLKKRIGGLLLYHVLV